MPRAKRKSDEIYNERRRARRLAARIEREAATKSATQRRADLKFAAQLREDIALTYAKVSDAETIEQKIKTLSYTTRRDFGNKQRRANTLFARQIEAASRDESSSLGSRGHVMTKIFYQATQDIWEGLPIGERNDAILRAMGETDLRSAFSKVLYSQRRALHAALEGQRPIRGRTSESAAFYEGGTGAVDEYASPDYLAYVRPYAIS